MVVKSGLTLNQKLLLHFTYHSKDGATDLLLQKHHPVAWVCQHLGRRCEEMVFGKMRCKEKSTKVREPTKLTATFAGFWLW